MEFPAIYTALVLLVGVALFASGRVRMDLAALGMLLALYLGGVLSAEQTLQGFSAPATISLGGIYVLSGAMRRSGSMALIGRWLLKLGRRSARRLTAVLLLSTAGLSAFMPNLAVTIIMMPVSLRLSRAANLRPGKLLLPVGLFASLGGYLTLLGTPPNLIISDLLAERTGRGFGLLDPLFVGLPILALTLAWVLFIGQRLLPDSGDLPVRPGPNLQELEKTYRLDKVFYRLRVRSGSDLAGNRLQDLDLRKRWNVNVVGVASAGGAPFRPWPGMVIEVNDELIVQGKRADILQMATIHRLEPRGEVSLVELARLAPADLELAEIMVPPYSPLVGRTLAEIEFAETFGLNALALLREGRASAKELMSTPLQEGDRLLVEGSPKQLARLRRGRDLVVLSDLGVPEEDVITWRSGRVLWILAGMVALSVSGLVSLPIAALMAAFATVLLGATTPEQAYRDIDWMVIVLVAALLPLGAALKQSGLTAIVAQSLASELAAASPTMLLALVFFLTAAITQVLANTVTALIMAPLAFDLAQTVGLRPEPFAMAVLLGVTTAFLTPLTDVINLLVRRPGGYAFRDYLVLNLPATLIVALAAIWLGPIIWPF